MLGLAEFTALSADLFRIARNTEFEIDEVIDEMPRLAAKNFVLQKAKEYYNEYEDLLEDGLKEIGHNALSFYQDRIGFDIDDPDRWVNRIVKAQYTDKYYNATLNQRLKFNRARLYGHVRRSSTFGTTEDPYVGLKNVFTNPVPYGAQYNIDKRLLLAQAEKLEQDIMSQVAKEQHIKLVRWTLSPQHPKADICDDFANNVDKAVVAYIEANDLRINPKGVYFAESIPRPPHPNCGCEFILITQGEPERGFIRRAAEKVRQLFQRLSSN